ncbi:hypothetical protein [Pseudonocardia spinosispora]|uniref:hypothetical protein n=1 Tax=Pseudonocardia spinosispora TaxID=103441 RepID=UPI0003F78A3E|nr:hypothetical protein [Pseudonocardia spinosispora]
MHRRIPLLTALGSLLAVLVVGCGAGGGPTTSADNAPPKHYASLAELGGAITARQQTDRTASVSMNGAIGPVTLSGEGAVRFDAGGTSMRFSQDAEQDGKPLSSQAYAMVAIGDQVYAKPPAGPGWPTLSPGKPWLKVSEKSTNPAIALLGQQVQSMLQSVSPAQTFTKLGPALTLVDTADEALGGTPTARYTIRMDLAKAAQLRTDPAAKRQLTAALAQGVKTVDSTLWLDSQDRILRSQSQQPLSNGQDAYNVDFRYHDWGQPVDIAAPPPAQVSQG